jgi:hypothetical protein
MPRKVWRQPPNDRGKEHALVAISFSLDAWIIDSGASYHMATSKDTVCSLQPCNSPPILMGDDTPIKVYGKGRVDLDNGSFKNVLNVPKLSINLLLVYQITHSGMGKQVVFTPDSVFISATKDGSTVVVGEVDHHARLYSFSHFVSKLDSTLLLMNDTEESIL